MVVIVDNGNMVKVFTSTRSASEYAERLMRKRHDVWVVNNRTAYRLGYI